MKADDEALIHEAADRFLNRPRPLPVGDLNELLERLDFDGLMLQLIGLITAEPFDDWHEEIGPVLWWRFPIKEPPYCGSPLDSDWTGYHTHWTPIVCPKEPT